MQEQTDLFSFSLPKFHIGDRKIKLIEMFGGVGSQALGLKRIGANFEHHRLIEFDKYCIRSYNAIHGTNFTETDIRDVKATDLDIRNDGCIYLTCYSFPCTDLSLAGKGLGLSKEEWQQGNSTRSGLLWEVERILDEQKELSANDDSYTMPQILLCENVPQLIGKKHIKEFNKWTSKLEQLGYSNYVKVMNACDYGIPQHRQRLFMVSILGQYSYEFPCKKELEHCLNDFLEVADEKYNLSNKMIDFFVSNSKEQELKGNGFRFNPIDPLREREKGTRFDN